MIFFDTFGIAKSICDSSIIFVCEHLLYYWQRIPICVSILSPTRCFKPERRIIFNRTCMNMFRLLITLFASRLAPSYVESNTYFCTWSTHIQLRYRLLLLQRATSTPCSTFVFCLSCCHLVVMPLSQCTHGRALTPTHQRYSPAPKRTEGMLE